ncbi:MAG: type II secretion system F family protein [Candidatus Atribacteria bacterium]|nr:type II secretion system F family protein [Candidatus Atribacteria bacterium]
MPVYTYKARDRQGKINEGTIEAQNQKEAVAHLRERGFFVTSLSEESSLVSSPRKETTIFSSLRGDRVRLQDLANFARGIATMLESGVPLLSALRSIAKQTTNPGFAVTIEEIASKIERGYSLSQALADYPKTFNRVFLGMVQSGEAGGNLDWTLGRLADYLEWEKDLRDKVQSATYYPMILLVAMIAASFFLVYFVFPQFVLLFESFTIELPLITKLVLAFIRFINANWFLVYGSFLGAVVLFFLYVTSERGRRWWDRKKYRLPLFGQLLHKLIISRFAWILNGLIRSGMPMVQALEVVATSLGDTYVQGMVLEIAENIRRGRNLSQSIAQFPFFPPMVVQMASVGEESGNLELTLNKVTELYDKEIALFVARLSSTIEPILTIIIGIGVFIVALSLFLPIFEIASKGMQGGGM